MLYIIKHIDNLHMQIFWLDIKPWKFWLDIQECEICMEIPIDAYVYIFCAN
jgi:hypothetical protein